MALGLQSPKEQVSYAALLHELRALQQAVSSAPWLAGTARPTLADLGVACRLLDFNLLKAFDWAPFMPLVRWVDAVAAACGTPFFVAADYFGAREGARPVLLSRHSALSPCVPPAPASRRQTTRRRVTRIVSYRQPPPGEEPADGEGADGADGGGEGAEVESDDSDDEPPPPPPPLSELPLSPRGAVPAAAETEAAAPEAPSDSPRAASALERAVSIAESSASELDVTAQLVNWRVQRLSSAPEPSSAMVSWSTQARVLNTVLDMADTACLLATVRVDGEARLLRSPER